jgi:hypothetical protein
MLKRWNLKAKVGSLSNKPRSPTNHVSSSVSVRETQAMTSCLIDGCRNNEVEDHIETRLRLVSRMVPFPSRSCHAVQVHQWYVPYARFEENWMCGICRYSASCQLTILSNLVALHTIIHCWPSHMVHLSTLPTS